MPSLLVTNDFPPKVGGIQSYLYELWRRLPPAETTVFTTPYAGDHAFDAAQGFRVERATERFLLPTPRLARRVDALARNIGADVIFVDPMLPVGAIGPRLRSAPYVVIAHGAEITVYGRLPGSGAAGRRVLRRSSGVVAAGTYPARMVERTARRGLRGVVVPPGVDVERFRPATGDDERAAVRASFGLAMERRLVLGVSRLVPRKGFDVLIDALTRLDDDVVLAIAGAGRDRRRLEARAARRGVAERVTFLGRVPDDELAGLYRSADVFAMPCRERWGGLEAEGFGIVFLEAAASGLPVVAGRSGGAQEAVDDGVTGWVVDPRSAAEVAAATDRALSDPSVRATLGAAGRRRAVEEFSYDRLARLLAPVARGRLDTLTPLPT
ncbi:MAG: glycosyltransferase family 4 protein [Actinobacteria bacterium]|nr:glycosyltransferase family 4 protein [Actinomycetota bacterium]